tara:strand:+ start:373 stop:1491 length:1119 start_codon:yes stop_codon:yes gene_type:complete
MSRNRFSSFLKKNLKLKLFLYYVICFFLFDYFLGQKILNYSYKKNILQNSNTKLKIISENEKKYRISHPIFHHTLKKNMNIESQWGEFIYKTCTDKNGFRFHCNKIEKYDDDFILIGDSFTEGIGLNYEKTFAGMLSKELKINFHNMGVASYSPSIYKKKINFFLKKKIIKPKGVLVFIDISDIDDEFYYYDCKNNESICSKHDDNISDIINKVDKSKINFPVYKKIKTVIRKIKRKFFPKVHSYEKNYHRSYWTYSKRDDKINTGITNAIKNMNDLYLILESKNIPLSLAVYPWPGQILYDKQESLQVKIWKDFCISRCKNYINLFPEFFKEIKTSSEKHVIKKYYLKNDVHFNEEGNKKIFNKLIEIDLF